MLLNLKLPNGGGVSVTYRETKEDKGVKDTIDWTVTSSENVHPDLINSVDELKEYLAKCFGMNSILVLANSKGLDTKESKAFKDVKKIIQNVHQEQMKKINMTGIAVSGQIENDKDKRSVIIKGTQLMDNKSKCALNSPRIKLNNNQFMFEGDVKDILDKIEEEVLAYLFDGKKAQIELFTVEDKKLSKDFIDGKMKKVADLPKEEAA